MNFGTPWIEVTIAGFVYISAIFFFILYLLKIRRLTFLKCLQPYAPYIAFVVLFSSYVCGFVAHTASSKLYALFSHDFKYCSPERIILNNERVPNYLLNSLALMYNNLVLFRHFSIATLLLGVALFLWLDPKQFRRQRIVVSLTCIIIPVIFVITYFVCRPDLLQLCEMMRAYAP